MSDDILGKLKQAILDYDPDAATDGARKSVEAGTKPTDPLAAMTDAIREIGEGFSSGELFLPDLVGAADAMTAAVPVVEAEIQRTGATAVTTGTVVIGTVFGDIHTIGKTMVATLPQGSGKVSTRDFTAPVRPSLRFIRSCRASVTFPCSCLRNSNKESLRT